MTRKERVTDHNSSHERQRGDAPITITTTPDGRIMLQSKDTAALDELEDLIASLTPPAPDFKVFHLKYAMASMVTLNLEEYFKEETQFDTDENWMRAYYGFDFKRVTRERRWIGRASEDTVHL